MRTARIVIGLVASATLLQTPARADLWIESYRECGGAAPTVASCTTHTHLRTNVIEHGFRLNTGLPYSGTLESRVEWLLGAHTIRCTYIGSIRQGECVREGLFPLPGTLYRHVCDSFDINSSTPGGSGLWNCYTFHSTGLFGAGVAN